MKRQPQGNVVSLHAGLKKGRIGAPQLQSAIDELLGTSQDEEEASSPRLPLSSIEAFICGPRAMIDECVANLTAIGLPQPQIHFESWW
jgi:ferredoxin-NADP reductase